MFKIVCMSRKTKEEKKIAAYRRKLKFNHQATMVEYPTETKKSGKTSTEIKESSENQQRKLFFIKDLKKSLFIICLIITLEIIIYFVRMNR